MSIHRAYQEVQKTSSKKPNKETLKSEGRQYAIPDDLYADLEKLGGSIDEHIDVAILAYLDLSEEERAKWMGMVFGQDDQQSGEEIA